MRLKPMRYKDYTWPHNPETYTVEYRRQVVSHKVPLGGWCLQDLGQVRRVLRGEGTFAGDGAYEEFQDLAAVFFQEGPGMLVHPVWRTERAWFAALTVEEEPLPDYVRYRFEFWEDWNGYDGGLREVSAGGAAETAGAAVPSEAERESAAGEKSGYRKFGSCARWRRGV